ncbi:MAG: hypothetical protein ACKN9T_09850 [Candidatus Methylumidiphilus sp.]
MAEEATARPKARGENWRETDAMAHHENLLCAGSQSTHHLLRPLKGYVIKKTRCQPLFSYFRRGGRRNADASALRQTMENLRDRQIEEYVDGRVA